MFILDYKAFVRCIDEGANWKEVTNDKKLEDAIRKKRYTELKLKTKRDNRAKTLSKPLIEL